MTSVEGELLLVLRIVMQTKDTQKVEGIKVYEIGYLLTSNVPEEKVADETKALHEILAKKSAEVIAEEAAELRPLAYTMVKKVGAVNQKFTQGYFGWVKFAVLGTEIEAIKVAFEARENMLRALLITTSRENIYLGKKAASPIIKEDDAVIVPVVDVAAEAGIDKGIDELVKETKTA